MIKDELKQALEKALGEKIDLAHPTNPDYGDFSTNYAMVMAKSEKKNPLELAEILTKKLKENAGIQRLVSKIQVEKPGFINFYLSQDALIKELSLALTAGERYFKNDFYAGKKLMVEFAHPNTHKEFHLGHLRNITIGESLCRLFAWSGAGVIRANYQGDMGLHIAKALWGVRALGMQHPESLQERSSFLARAYVIGNKAYGENPESKKEIEAINKQLYEGDKELRQLWETTRKWSLDYFDQIYDRLGTHFDRFYFESEVAELGRDLVNKYLDTVFEKSDGAVIFPGKKYGLHNRVFITSLGLPTYETKDIGLAHLQFSEFNPDKIIHVVGPEQTEYFKVVFSALAQVLPESKGKEIHLPYGWVRLKTGKMSSRTGGVVGAVWLLDQVEARLGKAYAMEEDVIRQVAVGAVKYSMLRLGPNSEIAFDIDQSIRLDGDSGPYLQYTVTRAVSVLGKSKDQVRLGQDFNLESKNWKLEPEEAALVRTIYRFPEVIEETAKQYAPNLVCNFLYELASKYNLLYNNLSILGAEEDKKQLRLALTQVTANILKTGLGLLGIAAPARM